VSYNLHGFNQGITGIVELIRLSSPDVFFVQEHWLTPDNLSKLDMINDDYFAFVLLQWVVVLQPVPCTVGPLVALPYSSIKNLLLMQLVWQAVIGTP
jgi:hypothetical protein